MTTVFEQLAQRPSIIVIGDSVLDHYWWGNVERISPEAPVPVVQYEKEEYRLGGAANVALNLAAMDAIPFLVSVVGKDKEGDVFLDLMKQHQLPTQGISRDDQRPTTTKTRILARYQQLLRLDRESVADIASTQAELIWTNHILPILQQHPIRAIVFQDYNKGVLSPWLIQKILSESKLRNIPTIVDPKKNNFFAYQGVTLFKPNLREINEGLGLNISDKKIFLQELADAANQIQKKLDNTYTCITLGSKGIYLHSSQHQIYLPARERQVADVCGAGDTVVSLLALGLATQLPIQTTITLANLAGGQVCEKMGVVPVDKAQLAAEFQLEFGKI